MNQKVPVGQPAFFSESVVPMGLILAEWTSLCLQVRTCHFFRETQLLLGAGIQTLAFTFGWQGLCVLNRSHSKGTNGLDPCVQLRQSELNVTDLSINGTVVFVF